jgi:hypothetical protein
MEWGTGTSKTEGRAAIYSETGDPVLVWRTLDQNCDFIPAKLHDNSLWFGAQAVDDKGQVTSHYISSSYENAATSPAVAQTDAPSEDWSSSSDLLLLQSLSGLHYTLYDRVTNKATSHGGGPGFGLLSPHPFGDFVLAAYDTDHERWEGQIWTRASQQFIPLVRPKGAVVQELASDGTTLVWIQTPPKAAPNDSAFPQGDIWTSPLAKAEADIKPTKRRSAPIIGSGVISKIGQGYYAFSGGIDNFVHLYRVSDMLEWTVPVPDGALINGVDSVDSEYVFFHTALGSYRYAIKFLGPGTP